jgi:hypothetical protein
MKGGLHTYRRIVRIRFGAIEGGDLKKYGPHLLLEIAELHNVAPSLNFCSVIHLQYVAGIRLIKDVGSWC